MTTPTAHAIVAIAVLIGTAIIFAIVALASFLEERHRNEAQSVELDALHRREAHETDQVRLKGLPDDSLQAELSKALGGKEKP